MTTPQDTKAMTPEHSPSQTPTPPNSTGVRAPSLGVKMTGPPTRSTGAESDPLDSPGGGNGNGPGPADPYRTGTPSDSERTEQAQRLNLSKGAVKDPARGAVVAAGAGLHHLLARYPEEISEGVWLIHDEREAASIADPLAAIVARRSGDTIVQPDAADLIRAGVAVGAYLLRNLTTAITIRWADRKMRRANYDPDTPAEGDEQQ